MALNSRLAQSFQMPMGRTPWAAAGNVVLQQNLQRASLMGAVQLASSDPLMDVSDITLSGQSLWVSSNPFGIQAFAGTASGAPSRFIGIPLQEQSQIAITSAAVAAAGSMAGSITTDPVQDDAPIASIDEFGPMLNYCGGLFPAGGALVGIGGTVVVNTVIRRDCVLGRLVIYSVDPATGLRSPAGTCTVDAIAVNNLALQSGPANTPSPVESFNPEAFDANGGNTLYFPAEVNSIVTITVTNNSAAAQNFFGGFWCLPPL
jgi:hypothetical protein